MNLQSISSFAPSLIKETQTCSQNPNEEAEINKEEWKIKNNKMKIKDKIQTKTEDKEGRAIYYGATETEKVGDIKYHSK